MGSQQSGSKSPNELPMTVSKGTSVDKALSNAISNVNMYKKYIEDQKV